MPDAVTGLFQTTLVVLYFVTPAETIQLAPGQKADFEKSKIWTLQSTSQIPTENPRMCVSTGLQLLREFDLVSTTTVRAYCLCPEHVTDALCDNAKKENAQRVQRKGAAAPAPQAATIIRIAPDTKP
jgi:hypothetical protein